MIALCSLRSETVVLLFFYFLARYASTVIVLIRIVMIILRFIPVPSVSPRSSSRLNALAHCILYRPESFGPVVDRLLELQKQNPAVSIESLLDQHGAGDPELRSLRKYLESLTPNMQRQDQLDWELVSRSPLPREPYVPNSLLVLHLAFHCSLDTHFLSVFCFSFFVLAFSPNIILLRPGSGERSQASPLWLVCAKLGRMSTRQSSYLRCSGLSMLRTYSCVLAVGASRP